MQLCLKVCISGFFNFFYISLPFKTGWRVSCTPPINNNKATLPAAGKQMEVDAKMPLKAVWKQMPMYQQSSLLFKMMQPFMFCRCPLRKSQMQCHKWGVGKGRPHLYVLHSVVKMLNSNARLQAVQLFPVKYQSSTNYTPFSLQVLSIKMLLIFLIKQTKNWKGGEIIRVIPGGGETSTVLYCSISLCSKAAFF